MDFRRTQKRRRSRAEEVKMANGERRRECGIR